MPILDIKPKSECRWDAVALGEVMIRLDPGDTRAPTKGNQCKYAQLPHASRRRSCKERVPGSRALLSRDSFL